MSADREPTPDQQPVEDGLPADVAASEAIADALPADSDPVWPESGLTEIAPDLQAEPAEQGGRLMTIAGGRLVGDSEEPATDPTAGRLAEALAALSQETAETADADESKEAGPSDDADAAPRAGEQELTTERVIEAILFATDTPLTLARIVSILGVGSARDVRKHINALNKRYDQQGSAFRIEMIAGGYQMLTRAEYNTWLRRLRQNKQDSRLSQAAMETLAVIAYKQPVVRAEIEAIRGVQSGEMLNRLRELGLVKIVGRAEDVGRPMLYGTTKRFLEVFGLSSLEDLPEVEELKTDEE
ncbi:MAG TPA: SMC-Scp complex subunit ScpB [Phycisphaerae bacterium]|nr:SMC-Scp complex subunit ScpB [Phycisphaerae bacterium]HRR84408.1 SMC-Scp complex subunit ScpB [Phycisphaerae bacterium]